MVAGAGLVGLFGGLSLWLQQKRRRRVTDAVFWFFRIAMICMFAFSASALVMVVIPGLGDQPEAAWWLGVLLLPGVFVAAINGMLNKIVPFVSWLHLQRLVALGTVPPNVREMLPPRAVRGQMALYLVALGLLLGAVIWPKLATLGGAAFAGSCAWLGWNLFGSVRVYEAFRDRIDAGAECPER
jgi:lysylphosphatidylglycerol synthetase-like protein (DUF2156 family)